MPAEKVLFTLRKQNSNWSAVAGYFSDGHMSHIEIQEELTGILLEF
jgi:hypothetical protein